MTEHAREAGLVSTIIPVYNRPILIVEAVNSVLAQTYNNTEVIVVDDGSDDDTPSVLLSLQTEHPQVTVLTQQNQGPGVARELGRQHAKGEFIQFLDSDDLLLPEKFALQVKALNESPKAVIAYGKTEMTDLHQSLSGVAMRKTGEKISSMFPEFLKSRWWGTSTPLYRACELDKAGAWLSLINEEDWEYDCRVASFGGQLAYVDSFVSHARRHDEHLSADGARDPLKLQHRCLAQQKIYQHAKNYMQLEKRLNDIERDDWAFFSKSVFLLARQCASVGLTVEAKQMFALSIEANAGKSSMHRVFSLLAVVLGWQRAALLIKKVGR